MSHDDEVFDELSEYEYAVSFLKKRLNLLVVDSYTFGINVRIKPLCRPRCSFCGTYTQDFENKSVETDHYEAAMLLGLVPDELGIYRAVIRMHKFVEPLMLDVVHIDRVYPYA